MSFLTVFKMNRVLIVFFLVLTGIESCTIREYEPGVVYHYINQSGVPVEIQVFETEKSSLLETINLDVNETYLFEYSYEASFLNYRECDSISVIFNNEEKAQAHFCKSDSCNLGNHNILLPNKYEADAQGNYKYYITADDYANATPIVK